MWGVKLRTAYVIGASGVGLIIVGVLIQCVAVPMILKSKVEETVAIRFGTEAYERWETLPVTMLFKVYIFEVLNPVEITEKGERPIVKERGPFVYRERRRKRKIQMFEEEDRAVYMQEMKFEFASDLSPEPEDTEITVVNLPAIGFSQVAESLPGLRDVLHIFNKFIDKMWPEGPIFIKVKAGDYLFNGIEMDCHYKKGNTNMDKLLWKILCLAYAYIRPQRTVILDDGEPGLNTFSFFKYKQNTMDGPYEVKLGIKEPERIGEILKWKGKPSLKGMWGGEMCNRLSGTDSTIYRPFLDGVDTLTAFNSDICRLINLTFDGESEYKGVPTRRYVTGNQTYAGVLDNPNNYCFCPRSVLGLTTMGGCMKSGLLDLSPCQGGLILLSNPHLLDADPSYLESVAGIRPNPVDHRIFVEVEPYTGYPMRGASRAQINVFLKKIPQLDSMKNYPDSVLPVIWLDEGVELSDDLVDEIKSRLLNLLRMAAIGVWVMIGVGAVMIIASVLLLVTGVAKRS